MSGISVRRCESCNEIALVVDRGRIRPVGEVKFVESKPGSTTFRCPCGGTVAWEWRAVKVGEQ